MSKKCCRLCYVEKSRPIGIFTTKGIRFKIVEIIQKHFPDAISENDIFPKFVCADCWTKLESFHEFYNAVDEAKSIYLSNFVKAEDLSFVEINCDVIESDEEFNSIGNEHMDYVEPATSDGQATKTENQSNFEKIEYDLNDNSEGGVSAADVIDNESDEDGFRIKFDGKKVKFGLDCNRTMPDQPSTIPVELAKKISEYKKNGERTPKTNPDVFKCNDCDKQFTVKSKLRSHIKRHLAKEYECDVCKKRFKTRENIRVHILGAHTTERQQYACHVCTKRFDTKSGINQHVRNVHERIGEVVCHICAKVYNSKVNLRAHLLDHADVPQPRVTCEICGNSFKSEQNRIRHVKRHQEKGVPCPHCHKISPNRNALKSHIVSVHSKPMLECHLCEKKFKRTLALTEHVATHTGEDLYSCAYCSQRFKYHSSLYLHYRGVHPIEWDADRKTKSHRQKRAEKTLHY